MHVAVLCFVVPATCCALLPHVMAAGGLVTLSRLVTLMYLLGAWASACLQLVLHLALTCAANGLHGQLMVGATYLWCAHLW